MKPLLIVVAILLVFGGAIYLLYLYAHKLGVKVGDVGPDPHEIFRGIEWTENMKLAKAKIGELGFRLSTTGNMFVSGTETTYLPSASDDVIIASFKDFEPTTFGEEITLYVHSSGNLCFLITGKRGSATGLVFEK